MSRIRGDFDQRDCNRLSGRRHPATTSTKAAGSCCPPRIKQSTAFARMTSLGTSRRLSFGAVLRGHLDGEVASRVSYLHLRPYTWSSA